MGRPEAHSPAADPGDMLVLVHGIWMTGLELMPLAGRLRVAGYRCRIFRYASLRRPPRRNAAALAGFVQRLGVGRVHFVAHSLGGIVLAYLFSGWPRLPPGRAVLLGTPLAGSGVARHLVASPRLRPLLGRSVEQGLLGGAPALPRDRLVGLVAGRVGLGVGSLVGGLERPGDGTVALRETRVEGLADWISLPVSHFGMLWSSRVSAAVLQFLTRGHFDDGRVARGRRTGGARHTALFWGRRRE